MAPRGGLIAVFFPHAAAIFYDPSRMGFVRALSVLAVSASLGSWFGLGRPTVVPPRPRPTVQTSTSRPTAEPPLPQAVDPSLIPSFGKWPKTNPEASIAKAWVVAEGPSQVHRSDEARRLVTFTFDDGPTPEVTPEVLAILKKHRVKATFFVIGKYLAGDSGRAKAVRRSLKKIVAAGHLVGNHTWSHSNLALLSPWEVTQEIDRSAEIIEENTGRRPILFRPPYGLLDDFGESAVRERDLELLLWSIEAQDMKRSDVDAMFDEMVAQLDYKEGGMVLLHDVKSKTPALLRRVLEWMRDRPRYEIVDLPTYLRAASAYPRAFVTDGS
jgi:peptidoglycan/xylan/chitin deacetylase (PgdA/CDA1 family)